MANRWDVEDDELIGFVQQLVQIPSVYDTDPPHSVQSPHTEAEAAEAVAAKMREWGWDPTVEDVVPGRPNAVAVLDCGIPGPTLMFEGHTDVVSPGSHSDWSFPPYCAEIRDGRLLGRGSADMKGGLAAAMYGVRALQLQGEFPGRIVVAALCDEEGMMLGAKHFAKQPLAKEIDGVVVCEPEDYEVCAVSKGAIRLQVTVFGKMAHGAMPQHGRNPVPVAARMIVRLAELQDQLQQRNGTHEHLGDDYITTTMIQAGDLDQLNVIPARAVFLCDIRTTPAVDHDDLLFQIRQIVDETALESDCKAEADVIDDRPPVDTPIDSPVVSALVQAHVNVVGSQPAYGGVPGTTDGTILVRDAALHSVVYGPGDKWIAHQADEWVGVDDVKTCARVYAETASIFLNEAR